jgi:hypothetical protein
MEALTIRIKTILFLTMKISTLHRLIMDALHSIFLMVDGSVPSAKTITSVEELSVTDATR